MAKILTLENVTTTVRPKNGQPVTILNNLSLSVERGEIVAVMGPSGSGKSTLLHAMSGLVASTGSIHLNGTEINNLSRSKAAAWRLKNIGFIFQAFHLQSYLTVLQNVIIPGVFVGQSRKESKKRAYELLEQLGIVEKAKNFPTELSGGEMQRVAIARAMICSPTFIFADEPTGNLDSENADKMISLLFNMRELYGTTTVIVTHDYEVAKRCDRTLYMENGAFRE